MMAEKKAVSKKDKSKEEPRADPLEAAEVLEEATLDEPQIDHIPEAETDRSARDFGTVTVSLEGVMPGAQVMAASSEELRESLQTLQGSLELLISGKAPDPSKSKKFLGIAYQEAEYLTNRASDLQLASVIESGRIRLKLAALDLNEILNSVIEKLAPAAIENEAEIELAVSDDLPVIWGNETLQRMLFSNLMERCIRAAPTNGKVLISVKPVGEYVELEIVSRGNTAPEYVEIVLNETSERGLALYIAEQIAYAHEGNLTFLGTDQEVKAVTLRLPVQLKERGRGKILIVDDNSNAATLLEYALEEEGYEPIKASNGLEGLKLAKSEQVDLVLLDMLLPGIDGFEVCHRLRAAPETASTPVIMISSQAREEDRATALRTGADAYFGKPLNVSELVEAIANLLEEGDEPEWNSS